MAAYEARVGRKVELIRIGPGDNWFCCQCERCLAPLTLPDGSRLECQDPDSIKDPLFRSTQIMMFVNEAMETWKQLRPDSPDSLAGLHSFRRAASGSRPPGSAHVVRAVSDQQHALPVARPAAAGTVAKTV